MVKNKSQIGNDSSWGLHWFRRDLRVAGNEALKANLKHQNGQVLGFFCFDSNFLARADFSANRFAFFLKTLTALKAELRAQGGDLLIVDSLPLEAFGKLVAYAKPALITWNRDYEPFARGRDEKIKEFLQSQNIKVETFRDHLLFEPHEILKSAKETDYYQIYSPYAKKWFSLLGSDSGQSRIRAQNSCAAYYKNFSENKLEKIFKLDWSMWLRDPKFPFKDALENFVITNDKNVNVPIPEAGSLVAFNHLQKFKKKIAQYSTDRNYPAIEGTSQLSFYLKNGSLVSTQILAELKLQDMTWEPKTSANQFVKEIAWREFYYSILFHRPDVEKTSFHRQYANLRWENNKNFFKRWQEGTTGFPIVDAGMRELLKTGWMHNRVRMIVASFLTKDLLIDWKLGENHFMKLLLDGDLAPNNGGWQWAASTGCDPQPYFRIFNPWLQSEKFDPTGEYIKHFVPELKTAPAQMLHDPEADRTSFGYPPPIVNHKLQKEKALALYRSAR